MSKKKEYDPGIMGRSVSGLLLRILVAAYIVYMAWKVLSGALAGGSPIPDWVAWAIFLVFAAAATAFCVYALIQFRKSLKGAEIPADSLSDSNNSDTHSESDSADSDK